MFAVAGQDKDWVEVSGGIGYRTGNVELSVGADTTIAPQRRLEPELSRDGEDQLLSEPD